jgi:chromosome segregation ATPase
MAENEQQVVRHRDALRAELARLRSAIDELRAHHEEEKALLTRTDATLAEREHTVDTGRDVHDTLLERYRSLATEVARLRALLP